MVVVKGKQVNLNNIMNQETGSFFGGFLGEIVNQNCIWEKAGAFRLGRDGFILFSVILEKARSTQ